VVCGGIHMSDIRLPLCTALGGANNPISGNLTRQDGEEFLALALQVPVRTEVQAFPLEQANQALERLRRGQLQGGSVLTSRRGTAERMWNLIANSTRCAPTLPNHKFNSLCPYPKSAPGARKFSCGVPSGISQPAALK